MLTVLVEDEPLRMVFHYLRDCIFMRFVFAFAIFGSERQPPDLRKHALFVEIVGHFFYGITGGGIGARIPVAQNIEPAVVERDPLNAHLFQFWNCAEHLGGSYIGFVSPAAPAYVVGFARRL